ncbi:hypothetical protein FRB95_006571 [Tulasnella sp. JGI-2019a]|nr:hypothetical protein FRB95_006571 [Tulasnella sp. JGI-2019a]
MRSPSVMAILVMVGTDLFAAAVLPHHKHDTHSRTIAAAAFGGAGIIAAGGFTGAAVRNWNNEKDIAAAVAEAKAEQESLLEATTATLLKAKGKASARPISVPGEAVYFGLKEDCNDKTNGRAISDGTTRYCTCRIRSATSVS